MKSSKIGNVFFLYMTSMTIFAPS